MSSSNNNNNSSDNNSTTIINNLSSVTKLTNQFYGLRHGQSLANVAKIISSDPAISTIAHGLSEVGKAQVRSSAVQFCSDYQREQQQQQQQQHNEQDGDGDGGDSGGGGGGGEIITTRVCKGVAIYTSDFTRARETAAIFTAELTAAGIPLYSPTKAIEEVRLRERYFGSWNGMGDEHYQDVWNFDRDDPNHTEWGVESVNSVVMRTSQTVLDIEDILSRDVGVDADEDDGKVWKVIFVAHGDVLQIAQTAFKKVDGRVHRSLDHLETASLREFVLQK